MPPTGSFLSSASRSLGLASTLTDADILRPMFRTARGFLLLAPPAFLAALASVVFFYPKAVSDFSPYPFLIETLGRSLGQRPVGRFVATSALFFLLPYLMTGFLLLLSDFGITAARRLWQPTALPGKRVSPRPLFPEARWTFIGFGIALPLSCGYVLVNVARGGELPGGINVAPLIIAAYPFLTTGIALAIAVLVAVPRGLYRWLGTPAVTRQGVPSRRGPESSSK